MWPVNTKKKRKKKFKRLNILQIKKKSQSVQQCCLSFTLIPMSYYTAQWEFMLWCSGGPLPIFSLNFVHFFFHMVWHYHYWTFLFFLNFSRLSHENIHGALMFCSTIIPFGRDNCGFLTSSPCGLVGGRVFYVVMNCSIYFSVVHFSGLICQTG